MSLQQATVAECTSTRSRTHSGERGKTTEQVSSGEREWHLSFVKQSYAIKPEREAVFAEFFPSSSTKERGRAGEIRTHDLLHPMQAFYQAELQPDLWQPGDPG